ncbi:dermonecrotic toxin domain-containing protein [Pseudomonas cannabina]|nr:MULTISPECIES: membrane-targeted effector domain-containing toxin [Pseudomonas syringae group]QHE99518.1 membrane-targeted effector domain-containing toxin [Pseudomonas syringae pv. maculicola str. ES4326]QQN21565.1 membrane-targeted effector domain-containing toxin [Pseudomonas cannabina pv. alisalensis]RMN96050.1 Type III effector HopAC1 [Pseudomonas cannabina]UBY95227.1 membrane-targeted effector domain-containing toxin [Pseudomonas cannabina pv. alisalensis]
MTQALPPAVLNPAVLTPITLTPVPLTPADTWPAASAALGRLDELRILLASELQALPIPGEGLLTAINAADLHQREQEIASLLQQIDDYWSASGETGERRRDRLVPALQRAHRDEASVRVHERDLESGYLACLPAASDESQEQPLSYHSLTIQLHDDEQLELAGALAISQGQERTVLFLPGLGIMGFASQALMRHTLARWLNTPTLQGGLLNTVERQQQEGLNEITQDADLYLEPFAAADVQLQRLTTDPFGHALDRLLNKQRKDIRYACERADITDPQQRQSLIQQAINLQGLLGPAALLELRELANRQRQYLRNLPDWMKIASETDLKTYAGYLRRYDDAHAAMLSVMGSAASPEQFAEAHLRRRLADDLGHDIDPHALALDTLRTLPLTHETYRVSRSLVQLALYGLHPDDEIAGSDFLEHTVIRLNDTPLPETYSTITPAYLASLIIELELRATFGEFQRTTYQLEHNQPLLRMLARTRLSAQAWAAKMQGHIRPEDFVIVAASTQDAPDPALHVQQVRLNGRNVMARLLVFRKQDAQGRTERLIMAALDAPGQPFKAFDSETQLLHEVVGWTASPAMTAWLLDQVHVADRPELAQQLEALKQKPQPANDFLQFVDHPDSDAALRSFTDEQTQVMLSEQASHTPDWYLRASGEQRRELLALEETIDGALGNYQALPHARVQPFMDYVHQRASEQIARLLNVPAGAVNPDLVVITSERETLTYTDMLLNGYDDSIDPLHSSADTQATFSGPQGVDLSALSPAAVAGSVRGQWLADGYIALVRNTLLNTEHAGYAERRQASVLITRLQMKAAALRSVLKGHIEAAQYTWLKQSLDAVHLNDPVSREQYPLYPLQIHIDKPLIASGLSDIDQLVIPTPLLTHIETVQGCLVILPTQIRHAALLYTPQAPDGIEFRLFGDFVRSLSTDGMIDYYKDRCRIKARRTLSFFLRDMQQGNANKPPVIPKAFISDVADTCYNRPLERRLRDVEETTTGRNDMLSKLIWISVEIIATALTLPFPPASFAVGSLLALHDSGRALAALTEGEHGRAATYIVSALFNGLGAGGDLLTGLKGFGGVLHSLEQGGESAPALRSLQRQSSLPRYEDLYPAELQEQVFLLGKPNPNGHAPVFHATPVSSAPPRATGQFAAQRADGAWQPLLSLPDARPRAPSGLRTELAVDLSLHDVPRITVGHATGVCVVNGRHYVELSGSTFQVHYSTQLRGWQIIDPQNPFAFFGNQPIRLDQQGQWQLVERQRLRGGGLGDSNYAPLPDEPPGSSTGSIPSDYEMPSAMQAGLDVVLSNKPYDPTGIGMEVYFESYFAELRQSFVARREKLYQDARTFLAEFTAPPRPQLPPLPQPVAVDNLIEHVFAHGNGLVFSEAPKSVASKRLLLLNMPLLAEQRVEVLYIQHLLTDKHLTKLARYRHLGKKSRSGSHEIKHYLHDLNRGALNNASTDYDYYHVIKAAHRYGIEVRPFSSSISYPFDGHPVAGAINDPAAAQKMSNFFGHTLINSDIASAPSRRWVALLDQKLATATDEVPGIADLQGVVSVHVQDIPAGRPTRIAQGSSGLPGQRMPTRSDFTIAFSDPTLIVPIAPLPSPTRLDDMLRRELKGLSASPDGERWAGQYGFVQEETGAWARVAPEDWSVENPVTAIQQSLADAVYEMPLETRANLHRLANFEKKGLDMNYLFDDPELDAVRETFASRRTKLQTDAAAISAVQLPPRPTLPAVTPQTSLPELFETLYSHTDGIVIGESHFSVASKKMIIDNLPLLAQQNVKTLYMEHLLTDLHQADLDRFFETGQMSKNLLHDLKVLDRGHRTDPDKVYTFEQLVIKARQQGVEVRAIDCAASYHLDDIASEDSLTRQQMMNYFASRTMRKHQEVMGSHKWIALVGNSHSNVYQGVVPGIAELEGGIGLRIIDVAPGHSRGITLDPGELVSGDIGTFQVHIKGDYRVEMEVLRARSAIRPPQPLTLERRLARPGTFLVEQGKDNQQTIVHRARDTWIHRTPVLVNAEGKLYLERVRWPRIHLIPFDDMDALVKALEQMHLTRIG